MTSTLRTGTSTTSTASGYPAFGRSEWYALSMARAIALFSTTRPLTMKVCHPRLLRSIEGFVKKPVILTSSSSKDRGNSDSPTEPPYMATMASRSEPVPGVLTVVLLLLISRNEIPGSANAAFTTQSLIFNPSVCVVFMNFLRAGVLKNKSSTFTVVPGAAPASEISGFFPPMMRTETPSSSSARRVTRENRETAAMVGSASPRKPRVGTDKISSLPLILLVACRCTESSASSRLMPQPLSVTRIRLSPPAIVSISMVVAPASTAFSISSLTTEAGRSTTSPAAILLTVSSSKR